LAPPSNGQGKANTAQVSSGDGHENDKTVVIFNSNIPFVEYLRCL